MTDPQSPTQSTTEPNTPEPCGITDESLPSGDFARLTPVSTVAKLAFHNLAEIINENLGTYRWHRRYLYLRDKLEELSEDDGESTGTESTANLTEIKTVRTGFWRFNLEIRPAEKRLGWILGKDTDYALKDYIIRSSFARGSSCYVCSAIDKTGGEVAVKKIIANSNFTRLEVENEVKTLRRITHDGVPPSISRIVDYIAIEPSSPSGVAECYLIFQPLIYTTLGNLLPHPDLSIPSRIHLVAQTLSGLAFIHSKGCMHRDIKPENVLASAPPLPVRAVIIDFGAATFASTSDDHMKGTIRYLAPEIMALKLGIAKPGAVYDKRADVWSMGLTAYEVICGRRFVEQYVTRSMWERMRRLEYWQLQSVMTAQAKRALDVVNLMLEWEAHDRSSSLQAREHDVFQEFDVDTGSKAVEQLGDKRFRPSMEIDPRPSTKSKTRASDN